MPRLSQLTAAALALAALAAPVALAQEGGRAAAPASAAAGPISLAPKFKKGDVHKFKYHVERKDTNSAGGMEQASDVTIDADLSLKVLDASDGGSSLQLTVETIKVEATLPDGKSVFDSTKPEDDKDKDSQAVQAFKPLVGMVLTLGTDSTGVVTLVSGEPAIPQGRSLAPTATTFFTNPDMLKFRWNGVLNARRDRAPTTVGQSWKHTDSFVATQMGKFETTLNNTLKAVHDGVADIDATGEMVLAPVKEGDKLAFTLKDTSILATSTWSLADGISKTFEMQRQFTLAGNAQGFDVVRSSREKVTFTRIMP